jgi:hypothetical protein
MTVEELIEQLKTYNPESKVVMITDYTPDYVYVGEVLLLKDRKTGIDSVLIGS